MKKPPISQKVSPISVKYSHIVSKPMYYSPKIKSTDPQPLPQKTGSNDFTSYMTNNNNNNNNEPPPISHFTLLKKSGSNEFLRPTPPSYFEFKQTQELISKQNNANEMDSVLVSTLRALRKENKNVKSEGDLQKCTLPQPQKEPDNKNSHLSLFQEPLNKDHISHPSVLDNESKPNKLSLPCQSTILDKCLPKFVRSLNISPSKENASKYIYPTSNETFKIPDKTTNFIYPTSNETFKIPDKTTNYKLTYNNGMKIPEVPPKKPELLESFANLISNNDSDIKVKPIKNIEFSANPFANLQSPPKNQNYYNNSTLMMEFPSAINNLSNIQSPNKVGANMEFPTIPFIYGFQPNIKNATFHSPVNKNWKVEDFELGKCLGKGKFGKVYLAREKKTRMIFALKCIVKTGMNNPACVEQMMREIKIHSFLNHINVIQLYGCFEDQLKVYLIMELAMHGNLFNQIHKQVNKRFDEVVVAGFLKQVLEAIRYLHSNFIIHRDIKPENILVSNGILKLADFGWSIYAPEDKRTTFCGTVDYVAPEIVSGSFYDAKVDLWSLGVLCFELTTGKAPFEHRVNREAFNNIVNLNFKFPEYLSEICKDFINRLLVKDPARRYDIEAISNHPFLGKAANFNIDFCDKKIKEFKETF